MLCITATQLSASLTIYFSRETRILERYCVATQSSFSGSHFLHSSCSFQDFLQYNVLLNSHSCCSRRLALAGLKWKPEKLVYWFGTSLSFRPICQSVSNLWDLISFPSMYQVHSISCCILLPLINVRHFSFVPFHWHHYHHLHYNVCFQLQRLFYSRKSSSIPPAVPLNNLNKGDINWFF